MIGVKERRSPGRGRGPAGLRQGPRPLPERSGALLPHPQAPEPLQILPCGPGEALVAHQDGRAGPEARAMTVTGRVVSGRGNATRHIGRAAESLLALTGRSMFPGSLNLVLSRPLGLSAAHGVDFERGRKIWPARIGDLDVWIYRWSTAPDTVIEILASERLRDALDLQGNERVAVTIPAEFVTRPGLAGYAGWLVFWSGRAGWYYRYDLYMRAVLRIERLFVRLRRMFGARRGG